VNRDSREPGDDPLKAALYRWLDPDRFGTRANADATGAGVEGRDRARLDRIVSESSAEIRPAVAAASLRSRAPRPRRKGDREPRRVRSLVAWLVLAAIGAAVAIFGIDPR
jgi:hypothetical protein